MLENQHERVSNALAPLQRAVALRERLAQRFPADLGQQYALAECLCSLGGCLRDGGSFKERQTSSVRLSPSSNTSIECAPTFFATGFSSACVARTSA